MIFPKQEFNKVSCKEANINKGILVDMFDKIEKEKYNIHSMLLLHQGSKVFDAYADGFDEFRRENTYSISKSFTSLAIGILIDLKLISLEDYVLFFFNEEVKDYLPGYEELKIKHLLTMTVGQLEDVFRNLTIETEPFSTFFNVELSDKPGTKFMYNNFSSFILSAIVTKVTGKSLNDFLNEYLYKIISMEKPSWDAINDYSFGCTGLNISVNDMARFGHLILNDGLWEDKQVVSKSYLEDAAKPHIKDENSKFFYGYHFWVGEDLMAAGMYKQYIIINKKYNLVFAMQAYEEKDVLGLFYNYILKAMDLGWKDCGYSLRDYTRRFQINSRQLIEKEKVERYG